MPRATKTKNVPQEHQDTAPREARPRKARAPKKGAVHSSDTRPDGPEQGSNKGSEGPEEGSNKGSEGPEEGGGIPHLTTMPLQSWGEGQRPNPSDDTRLAPHPVEVVACS